MVEIKFTADACGFKEGDTKKLDPSVAWGLVHNEKVAEYTDKKAQEAAKGHIAKVEKAEKKRKAEEKEAQKKADERFNKLKKEKTERFKKAKLASSKRFVAETKEKKVAITKAQADKLRKTAEDLLQANEELQNENNTLKAEATEKDGLISRLQEEVAKLTTKTQKTDPAESGEGGSGDTNPFK